MIHYGLTTYTYYLPNRGSIRVGVGVFEQQMGDESLQTEVGLGSVLVSSSKRGVVIQTTSTEILGQHWCFPARKGWGSSRGISSNVVVRCGCLRPAGLQAGISGGRWRFRARVGMYDTSRTRSFEIGGGVCVFEHGMGGEGAQVLYDS